MSLRSFRRARISPALPKYTSKGTSVCRKSLVPGDAIEHYVFAEVEKYIRECFDGEKVRKKLLATLHEVFGPEEGPTAKTRERLLRTQEETEQKIYSIIENATPATREFADRGVAQLKNELDRIACELEHLDTIAARRIDMDIPWWMSSWAT